MGQPLAQMRFFRLTKKFFYGQKKCPFYLDHYLTLYLVLFKAKTNNENICIF